MRKLSSPYPKIFKTHFIAGLAYRGAALSGILTQVFWGFMQVLLFSTLFSFGHTNPNFTQPQMMSYIWLQQAFMATFYLSFNSEIVTDILNGGISYELVRPINVYNKWFASTCAKKLSAATLRFLPIIVLGFALSGPNIGLSLPASVPNFVLFLVTIFTGLILSTVIVMFIYMVVTKTLSDKACISFFNVIHGFLSGFFMPIPLMPKWLQDIISFFPFRYTSDLCYQTYIGSISLSQIGIQIGIQVAWIVGLMIIGKLILNRMFKKVVVQGG